MPASSVATQTAERLHACEDEGRCSAVDKKCTWADDADCAKHPFCGTSGACSFDKKTKKCAPLKDEDCAKGKVCQSNGYCGFEGGSCKATKDSHCSASKQCKNTGACGGQER